MNKNASSAGLHWTGLRQSTCVGLTRLFYADDRNMRCGAKLHVDKQNEMNGGLMFGRVGVHLETIIMFMKAQRACGSVPASSAVGACVSPAGGGREGKSQAGGDSACGEG